MTAPRATVRLQFHDEFTFADAAEVVPYFARLGISHVYASPIAAARPGSRHGYDVIDPSKVDPRLGGKDALRLLVAALRKHGMGLIIDIVPNHMAAVTANPWWADVLRNGRSSRYAGFFDIDWEVEDPALRGKVQLPILGRPYEEALAAGEIRLGSKSAPDELSIRYFDHALPLSDESLARIDPRQLESFDPATAEGRERLQLLLERQHYRLAWWRLTNEKINWRRFFDINDLVALRMENETTFEAVHATVFHLYADGLIDGIRVDHIDGLAYPEDYCRKVRSRLHALEPKRPSDAPKGSAYFVVEKILAADESLPETWLTDGTTGYDFMDQVSAVFHDPAGEQPLTDLWFRATGKSAEFSTEEKRSRREILVGSFSAQLDALVNEILALAHGSGEPNFSRATIRLGLEIILSEFPVYRIYANVGKSSQSDRAFFSRAVRKAKTDYAVANGPALDFLEHCLLGEPLPAQQNEGLQASAMRRFQQLSAPLCAKAVEDTAFYRYGRLVSRNDVGFDPQRFADSASDFHRYAATRGRAYPRALLATATHDHKRGEDVRARITVLSEIPEEWAATLDRLLVLSAPLQTTVDGLPAPRTSDLVILFQSIVGAWPPQLALDDSTGLVSFAERIAAWERKSLREAKQASDWTVPHEAYETAAHNFILRLFTAPSELLGELAAFARCIGAAGAVNGLSQTLLKLTSPGVPDFYQGTEYWDTSLVDPDNRRPVDFQLRSSTLQGTFPAALVKEWSDGRIKQALIARVLAARQVLPRLFAEGSYVPLQVHGPLADHVIAFARLFEEAAAVTVVCRSVAHLLEPDGSLRIDQRNWNATRLVPPPEVESLQFLDVLAGGSPIENWQLARLCDALPVAFLLTEGDRARRL